MSQTRGQIDGVPILPSLLISIVKLHGHFASPASSLLSCTLG